MSKQDAFEKRAAKKALVLGTQQPKRWWISAVAAGVAMLGIAGFFVVRQRQTEAPASAVVAPAPTAAEQTAQADGVVMQPISLFSDGLAKFFTYQHGNITIRYFILKSSDTVIRAAFDACDVCWPAGKGYYQDGNAMVCRNCGRRFPSMKVNETQGGCNPSPLNHTLKDGLVVIQKQDLIKGAPYFDLPKQS